MSACVVCVCVHVPKCALCMSVCACVFVGCCLATKTLNLNNTKSNGWKC